MAGNPTCLQTQSQKHKLRLHHAAPYSHTAYFKNDTINTVETIDTVGTLDTVNIFDTFDTSDKGIERYSDAVIECEQSLFSRYQYVCERVAPAAAACAQFPSADAPRPPP